MKSLRLSALVLALGAFSIFSRPAHAQQEVDPDHFDQPLAASSHIRDTKMEVHHKAPAVKWRSSKQTTSARLHMADQRLNTRSAGQRLFVMLDLVEPSGYLLTTGEGTEPGSFDSIENAQEEKARGVDISIIARPR